MDHRFLAFDFGAESGRALLATARDGRITLDEVHRFANPNGTMLGTLQWDLLGQWEQIKQGMRGAAAKLSGATLDGIGVDTWGVDFGLLASDGSILGNPVCYRDGRTRGMFDLAFSRMPRRRVFDLTGIQFMELNTLFQLLALKQTNPRLLESASTMLLMPDLFNYLLTGVARAESSIASTTQLLDVQTGRWSVELIRAMDLPLSIFPPIVPSGSVLGPVRDDVASETGLRADVIAPASHDTASAVLAVPAQGDSWCYLSSGTWSLIGIESPTPIVNDLTYHANLTNEGGFGGTVRVLKNIMGLWLVQECRRAFARAGREYDYATLTDMASKVPSGVSVVHVNDATFVAPGDMPGRIAEFCRKTGQPIPSDDAAMIRTCLDSLALQYRLSFDEIERVAGRKLDVIHIVGGGSQNALLNQLTADACGRPVVAGPVEATALGNVLAQMLARGVIKHRDEARQIVRQSFPVRRFDPSPQGSIDVALDRYRRLASAATI
jgi:rhamnulokinase